MKKWLYNWGWVKSSPGETVLEVLVALVVITIGAATASSLIVTSLKANSFNKDSLIALNLAQEGLEYMRNWRDSNWIKFSADTQRCWNMKPGVTSCNPNDALAEAVGAGGGYALGDVLGAAVIGGKLDLSDGVSAIEQGYRLKYFDLNASEDSDKLERKDSGGRPREADDYDFVGSFYGASSSAVDESKFYRSIEVDYKKMATDQPWGVTELTDSNDANIMEVTSTVQWKEGPTVHQAKLTSKLSRYK